MPDIVVVGGGIIGAACAFELAERGAAVTLLEKDELAAGASGRNLGYLDTSKDPVLAPLARRSLERYAEISADPPTPFFLDDEPIGTLAVTIDEDEIEELRAWAASAEAVGVALAVVSLPPELVSEQPASVPARAALPANSIVRRLVPGWASSEVCSCSMVAPLSKSGVDSGVPVWQGSHIVQVTAIRAA